MKKKLILFFIFSMLFLISCGGRIGFIESQIKIIDDNDNNDDDDDNDNGSFLISSTKPVGTTSLYVEIDVDWEKKVAYLASQQPGICFEVIDIEDELNPTLIKQLGTSTSPSTTANLCRGLSLFDGKTKLILGSHGDGDQGVIEAWDIGLNPREQNYSKIHSLLMGHSRRVAGIDESGVDPKFYFSNRSGVRSFLLSGGALSQIAAYASGSLEADAVLIDDKYLLTGGWGSNAALELIDKDSMTRKATFGMAGGQTNTSWSAAISADGTKIFYGGWVSAFLKYDAGKMPDVSVTYRFDNDTVYRDAIFVEDGDHTFLYAVRSDLYLDVFLVDDIYNPTLVFQTALTGNSEAYALRVNTDTRRVLIATSKGDLIFGNIDHMDIAVSGYPTFEPSDKFTVSSTDLNTAHSYVEVAVDWTNKYAYASSVEAGYCFDMIDFSNEQTPIVVKRFGTDAGADFLTTCNNAIGIELFDNNQKLIISAESPGNLEVWNLGADPSLFGFTQSASIGSVAGKRVASIYQSSTNPARGYIFISKRSGVSIYDYDESVPSINLVSSWTDGNSHNASMVMGPNQHMYFVTGEWINGAPANIIDIPTMTLHDSIGMDNGGTSGMWASASSSDMTKGFIGGWVNAFLKYDGGEVVATHFFDNEPDNSYCYRDAVFVTDAWGNDYLYAIQNNLYLDVFDVSDINNPVLTHRTKIRDTVVSEEGYSLQVNLDQKRVFIVTNEGYVIIGNIYDMTPADYQHEIFIPY